MKTENWLGHTIRFVEKNGEWWAVLADITEALTLTTRFVIRRLPKDVLSKHPLATPGGMQEMAIVNERGIYKAIFQSRKKEAEEFQDWVYSVLCELRRQTGLEGFQVFRMLDKEHQRAAMSQLSSSLRHPVRVDFIKANTIANKAISTKHGEPKMLKKEQMTPAMLVERQTVLDDTVELMSIADKFRLPISVSDAIYGKFN